MFIFCFVFFLNRGCLRNQQGGFLARNPVNEGDRIPQERYKYAWLLYASRPDLSDSGACFERGSLVLSQKHPKKSATGTFHIYITVIRSQFKAIALII